MFFAVPPVPPFFSWGPLEQKLRDPIPTRHALRVFFPRATEIAYCMIVFPDVFVLQPRFRRIDHSSGNSDGAALQRR